MRLKLQGNITSWNDEKGFGFITPVSGGDRVFIHIKAFKKSYQRPQVNQQVSYSLSKDKQGRSCAADVTPIGKKPPTPQRRISKAASLIFVTLFFSALGILTFVTPLIPTFIITLYAIASTITFITYAIDKSAAQKGHWRTSEATLHTMSFFGGWPGALIAQQTLRHKSKKETFQGAYKCTVILNIVVTAWLFTPRGPELTLAFLDKIVKIID
jgi:uncharacterized membrane protein YsdA (DUF1294 family)/cold shock CspA family protein